MTYGGGMGKVNWKALTIDQLRQWRRTALQQRRVCLPNDRAGWDRIVRETQKEFDRREDRS